MRKKKDKYYPSEVGKIHETICLFLRVHSRGLHVMLGGVPFPDGDELLMMLRFAFRSKDEISDLAARFGVTDSESAHADAAAAIWRIASDGGIERINAAFRRHRDSGSADYRILEDWVLGVRVGPAKKKEAPIIENPAERYGVSHPNTLRRRRERLLLEIAADVWHDAQRG